MCLEQSVSHVSGINNQIAGGLGGNRTPDALLRTEALYPLSYEAGDLMIPLTLRDLAADHEQGALDLV